MRKWAAIVLFVFCALGAASQELKMKPRFISFRNARVSMGLGFEMSLATKPAILYHSVGTIPSDTKLSLQDSFPYLGISLAFDIYSPNSVVGLYSELSYSIYRFGFKDEQLGYSDNFDVRALEIPLYLKFRPGTMGSKRVKMWLLLGGSYVVPISTSRNGSRGNYVNHYPGVGGAIGMEAKLGRKTLGIDADKARFVIYLRANYSLTNKLNVNKLQSEIGVAGIDYSKTDYRDVIVSLGMKLLFRVNRYKNKSPK